MAEYSKGDAIIFTDYAGGGEYECNYGAKKGDRGVVLGYSYFDNTYKVSANGKEFFTSPNKFIKA